jgi:uncharacterized SAM-binding protein YcdF (DUF218 family)
VAGCVLLIAAVIGGVPLYVRPQIDPLRHADAILILGGTGRDRYPFGIELGVQGWAPTVVISLERLGHNDPWTEYCAKPNPRFSTHCFVPDPPNTAGEAQELRRLATRYGWRTVIVVTFRPHISRARFILKQCFDGDLVMVASPADLSVLQWGFEYLKQTAAYVRAAVQPGC